MYSRTRSTLALVACGAFLAAFFAPGAKAVEPQSGPTPSPTFRVVLTHPTERVTVSVTTDGLTPRGYHCASVWSTVAIPAFLGRGCSALSSTFLVPITIDARTFPLGRSQIEIVDDAAGPPRVFPDTAFIEVRRLSTFGRGYWEDKGQGNLFVRAPILLKDPITGRLRPQQKAPVQVRELTRRGWRWRATFYSVNGVAQGTFHIGPGVRVVDVYRPTGATVTSTTGTKRTVNVNQEPIDPKG